MNIITSTIFYHQRSPLSELFKRLTFLIILILFQCILNWYIIYTGYSKRSWVNSRWALIDSWSWIGVLGWSNSVARSTMWGEVRFLLNWSELSSAHLSTWYGYIFMQLLFSLYSYVNCQTNRNFPGRSWSPPQRYGLKRDHAKSWRDRLWIKCSRFHEITPIKKDLAFNYFQICCYFRPGLSHRIGIFNTTAPQKVAILSFPSNRWTKEEPYRIPHQLSRPQQTKKTLSNINLLLNLVDKQW